MGANQFSTVAHGKNAQEAFKTARAKAQYDHGHSGYTGTIAEKTSFIELTPDVITESPRDFAMRLLDTGDIRIDNKWGPAGCVKIGGREYLFFGWASS